MTKTLKEYAQLIECYESGNQEGQEGYLGTVFIGNKHPPFKVKKQ